MSGGYVVYYCEHMRDGQEEGARVFGTMVEAKAFLERMANESFARDNYTFRLFELGKEIVLNKKRVNKEFKVEERAVYAFDIAGETKKQKKPAK